MSAVRAITCPNLCAAPPDLLTSRVLSLFRECRRIVFVLLALELLIAILSAAVFMVCMYRLCARRTGSASARRTSRARACCARARGFFESVVEDTLKDAYKRCIATRGRDESLVGPLRPTLGSTSAQHLGPTSVHFVRPTPQLGRDRTRTVPEVNRNSTLSARFWTATLSVYHRSTSVTYPVAMAAARGHL